MSQWSASPEASVQEYFITQTRFPNNGLLDWVTIISWKSAERSISEFFQTFKGTKFAIALQEAA
jgi:hypothetical protein